MSRFPQVYWLCYLATFSCQNSYYKGGQVTRLIILVKAAPFLGICIGIGPIPAFFDGIGIGQVCCTSTNSVVCALLTIKLFFFSKLSSQMMTSIVFPCISIGTCTCEYI